MTLIPSPPLVSALARPPSARSNIVCCSDVPQELYCVLILQSEDHEDIREKLKYAINAEQRRKSMKHAKEIRPLLQYQLSRLEFAMKTFYETKIRNFLLLEKRKWEDFVFDLVKSKINGRQDSGSANHSAVRLFPVVRYKDPVKGPV